MCMWSITDIMKYSLGFGKTGAGKTLLACVLNIVPVFDTIILIKIPNKIGNLL